MHPEDLPLLAKKIEQARPTATASSMTRSGCRCQTVQEVAEHRLAEEALTQARTDLAHVTRVTSLGMLTASIAHEVNQPLSGIINNAGTCLQMLAAEPPNVEGLAKPPSARFVTATCV
jgi:C4-dicarboxylate-specific signal transduction histidine kinase